MLTIIHGDDLKASRDFYISLRANASSPVILEGKDVDITSLTQVLSGSGLFDEQKAVFIEQLLTKRKKSKELDELISVLTSHTEKDITLWEGKELDRKILTLFPKAVIRPFKLPMLLFSFLDSLRPDHGTTLIKSFHELLETVEEEMVFSMLVRQLRLMLAVGSAAETQIDEVKRLQPWQAQKLRKQHAFFPEDALIRHYKQLFDIDYSLKTGRLATPLSSAIDIWLLSL